MKISDHILSPLIHLMYPHNCLGCGSDIIENENLICLSCTHELPHTSFAMHAANPVEKIFWGRVSLIAAASEFYFSKGSVIQTLIHEFKYNGNLKLGEYLGCMVGENLAASHRFETVDLVVPMPLFAAKQHKRGFNQAAVLGKGISKALNIPLYETVVERRRFTETQTKKHRTERWENVSESFQIHSSELISGRHILLVDDVITTGATLEACGAEILKIEGTRISIATLAYASK